MSGNLSENLTVKYGFRILIIQINILCRKVGNKELMKRSKTAFTLIELLIVIAIIAILALIAIPNFLEAQTRSKVSRTMADARTLATAIEAYVVDWNTLPLDADDYDLTNPANMALMMARYNQKTFWPILTTPVGYITSIPFDPFNMTAHDPASMTGVLFPGAPPFPYAYMTLDAFNANPAPPQGPPQAAHGGHPISYGVTSLGPNLTFDSAVQAKMIHAIYDPSNGTISYGDVIRYGGQPPDLRK